MSYKKGSNNDVRWGQERSVLVYKEEEQSTNGWTGMDSNGQQSGLRSGLKGWTEEVDIRCGPKVDRRWTEGGGTANDPSNVPHG